MNEQLDAFGARPALPDGFRYEAGVISRQEEADVLGHVRTLPFREFEFRGYLGKRRVVSFGWKYDFAANSLTPADPFPDFLLPIRERAAAFGGVRPDRLVHALVTEYSAGATIGWHRDRGVFGDVIGLSLLASCVFRLRRRSGTTWERASVIAEPRSAYLLTGPARTDWQHSIPPVETLRYSITFRTLRDG